MPRAFAYTLSRKSRTNSVFGPSALATTPVLDMNDLVNKLRDDVASSRNDDEYEDEYEDDFEEESVRSVRMPPMMSEVVLEQVVWESDCLRP